MKLLIADSIKSRETSFMRGAIDSLSKDFDVEFLCTRNPADIIAAAGKADIVWLEFCTNAAVELSRQAFMQKKKLFIRLHGYEAFDTTFSRQLDYRAVTAMVFPGVEIYRIFLEACGDAGRAARSVIIPNGVDTGVFKPSSSLSPYNVAWVGHIELKKDPMMMLQILDHVVSRNKQIKFHVAGEFTHFRTRVYIENWLKKSPNFANIRFYGHIDDISGWYADKGVILSTSMHESFGLSIGEAMAVGCAPVIYSYSGAELMWPADALFTTVEEAARKISEARPGRYCDFIAQEYPITRWRDAIKELLVE